MQLGMNWGAGVALLVLSSVAWFILSWVFWFVLRRVVTSFLLAMVAPLLLALAAVLLLNHHGISLDGRVIVKSEKISVWSNKEEGSFGWGWDRKLQYQASFQPPGDTLPQQVWLSVAETAFDRIEPGSPVRISYWDRLGLFKLWRGADYSPLSLVEWLGDERLFRVVFMVWGFIAVCAWALETPAEAGHWRTLWASAGFALWLGVAAYWWVLPWWKSTPSESWLRTTATVRKVHQLGLNEFFPSSWVELSFVPAGFKDAVVALDQVDASSAIGLGKGHNVEVIYSPDYPRAARLSRAERTNTWKTWAVNVGFLASLFVLFLLLRGLWRGYWNRKMAPLRAQGASALHGKSANELRDVSASCVHCGKALPDSAQFCDRCGKPRASAPFARATADQETLSHGSSRAVPPSGVRFLAAVGLLALGGWFVFALTKESKRPSDRPSGTMPHTPVHGTGIVPLREGLTVVTAVEREEGDSESIKTVQTATADAVQIVLSSQLPNGRYLTVRRTVRRADLQAAHKYWLNFGSEEPEEFPGTTALGASTEVLNELKSKGEASFVCRPDDHDTLSGTIATVQAAPVMIPVLVNNQRVELPSVQARGTLDGVDTEFWFLDDTANPLTLRLKIGYGTMQVIKIFYPESVAQHEPAIEQTLKQTGRSEVYGIYFDFGKATIRSESEPVLREIFQVLDNNPTWKLSVEGHTDNVGTDSGNQQLSERRAAAVKQALVERYEVNAERLSTSGFGETRPRESNESLAGRARNRRVELVKH